MKKPVIRRNFRKIQQRIEEVVAEDHSPIQIEILNPQEKDRYWTDKTQFERAAMSARNNILGRLDSSKLYTVRAKGTNNQSQSIEVVFKYLSPEAIKELFRAIDAKTPISGRTSDGEFGYYQGGVINRCFILPD
jgi:hypothetical protein